MQRLFNSCTIYLKCQSQSAWHDCPNSGDFGMTKYGGMQSVYMRVRNTLFSIDRGHYVKVNM